MRAKSNSSASAGIPESLGRWDLEQCILASFSARESFDGNDSRRDLRFKDKAGEAWTRRNEEQKKVLKCKSREKVIKLIQISVFFIQGE